MKGQGAGNAEVRVWGKIPRYQDGSLLTLISQINVLYGHWRRQVQRAQITFQKSTLTLLLQPLTPAHLIFRKIIGGTVQEMSAGDELEGYQHVRAIQERNIVSNENPAVIQTSNNRILTDKLGSARVPYP